MVKHDLTLPIDCLCLKRNLIIFKTNSLQIRGLSIASFDLEIIDLETVTRNKSIQV